MVLLLDELDYLVTKTQSVIYNVFERAIPVIHTLVFTPVHPHPCIHTRVFTGGGGPSSWRAGLLSHTDASCHLQHLRVGHPCPFTRLYSHLSIHTRVFTPVYSQEVVVLLLDELDYLVTRTQSVIYNIFEWATCPFIPLYSHPLYSQEAVRTVAAPPSIVVKCGVVLRVVVCGVVLVVSCVVLFLLCVCVCDLFFFLHPYIHTLCIHRRWWFSFSMSWTIWSQKCNPSFTTSSNGRPPLIHTRAFTPFVFTPYLFTGGGGPSSRRARLLGHKNAIRHLQHLRMGDVRPRSARRDWNLKHNGSAGETSPACPLQARWVYIDIDKDVCIHTYTHTHTHIYIYYIYTYIYIYI